MEKLVESFSGVRGIYGKSLTDEIVRKYATVYAQYLMDGNKKVRVVIGRDTRASGKKLQKIFTQKFLKFGFNVIDVGTAGTPAVELGVREYKACGGVMITASHNEPEFNGFKMLGSDGAILLVKESERIIKKVHTFKNTHDIATKRGKLINKKNDLDNRYVRYILKIIGYEAVREIRKSNFKLVADPNGGPVREVIEKLFRKLNVEIVGVNMKEGKFMRQVEPTVKSLAKLRSVVKNKKADFGFGLDLDADRMEIVLANGKMVSGNEMMALGVESVLSTKAKGQKVVVNLPTSHLVHEIIKKYKGNISEVDVGETNVVTKMTALGSKVGGEGSCGGLIVSPSKCRDGLLSVAVILALMARQNISLIEILKNYPRYSEQRLRAVAQKDKVVELRRKLIDYFRTRKYKMIKVTGNMSGIKILFDQFNWLFFRSSQTEPGLFRIIANGRDEKIVNKMIKQGRSVFNKLSH